MLEVYSAIKLFTPFLFIKNESEGFIYMIKFANTALPEYIKVTDVRYSILPTISTKTEKVYGRAGLYDFGTELGERKFEVDIMIIADNQNDVMAKAREFSSYLYHKELQPLILLDEPDKRYMARVTGDTNLSELYRTGTATITFLCPSPYAESLQEKLIKVTPLDYTPISVINNGSAETYPIIEMTMKQPATSIAVISEDKFVQVGESAEGDSPVVDYKPIVLSDNMSSYSGWTSANSVDGGIIAGDFASTGTTLVQAGADYGTGTGWHGASAVKSLSRPVKDFEAVMLVKLTSKTVQQVGRIELYLLDENNVHVGKIAIVDSDPNAHKPRVEARAGAIQGGHYFVNSHGDRKGVFHDYYGVLQISRTGQTWKAYFAKIGSDGKHHTRLNKTWYDHTNTYSAKSVSKVQIHIGAFGEKYPPVTTMYVTDLKVTELLSKDSESVGTPLLFNTGDIVTIDNQRAIVLKNGEPIFSELDPSSDFFAIEKGANGLIVSPPIADVNIRYREKWL